MEIKYFTVKQVAEYLKVSPTVVYKLVKTTDIPYTKLGKSFRFCNLHIDIWMDKNSSQPIGMANITLLYQGQLSISNLFGIKQNEPITNDNIVIPEIVEAKPKLKKLVKQIKKETKNEENINDVTKDVDKPIEEKILSIWDDEPLNIQIIDYNTNDKKEEEETKEEETQFMLSPEQEEHEYQLIEEKKEEILKEIKIYIEDCKLIGGCYLIDICNYIADLGVYMEPTDRFINWLKENNITSFKI